MGSAFHSVWHAVFPLYQPPTTVDMLSRVQPNVSCFDRCLLALLITHCFPSSHSGRLEFCCGNSWPAAPRRTPTWTPSTSRSSFYKGEDCYSPSFARTPCKHSVAPTYFWSVLRTTHNTPRGGGHQHQGVQQRAIVNHPQTHWSSRGSSELSANSAAHDYLWLTHIDSQTRLYDMSQPPNILHTRLFNNQPVVLWIKICGSSLPTLSTASYQSHISLGFEGLCSTDCCRKNNGKLLWNDGFHCRW